MLYTLLTPSASLPLSYSLPLFSFQAQAEAATGVTLWHVRPISDVLANK